MCQQFLHDEGIDAVDWPARSSCLVPSTDAIAPQTVQELTDALIQVWEEIPEEKISSGACPGVVGRSYKGRGGNTLLSLILNCLEEFPLKLDQPVM